MNYELSLKILEKIEKANNVLINCHRSPDPDSVGSALSLYQVLKKMGKKVKIICPDNIGSEVKFLPYSEFIEKTDFANFNFSSYDLFITLDSGSWNMASSPKNKPPALPKIFIIAIDHHMTNEQYGGVNLVDNTKSSTAEMLFLIFKDWGVDIDKNIAQTLLAGIIGDTGTFEYPGVTGQTLEIASLLMEKGANKDEIVLNIFRTIDFNELKFWGEIIKRMELDENYKFVWSAIPYEVFDEFSRPVKGKETGASMFTQVVENSDFGMVMVEQEKGCLSVSFRSRNGFDVSKIAIILGGGGHIGAAGAKVFGLPFEKGVQKVLDAARKVRDENKN